MRTPTGRGALVTWPPAEIGLRLAAAAAWFAAHTFNSNVRHLWHRFHPLSIDYLPYRDFTWEYPPLSVLPMLPARVLGLRPFQVTFVVLMIAAEYAGLRTLRRAFPTHALSLTTYWTAVVVLALPISWFVIDPLSVLFACLAIVAFRSERDRSFTVSTTLGIAAKLWPGALLSRLRWHAGGVLLFRPCLRLADSACVVGVLAVWL